LELGIEDLDGDDDEGEEETDGTEQEASTDTVDA
jgi:hypothetical protein